MPYINKFITIADSQKAYEVLINSGFKMREAQRLIDRGRLLCDGVVVNEKNAVLNGEICLIDYETNPRGLEPIFECEQFAVFDKPSGVLSHPNGRNCEYSLNDEIWHLYGREASVAHRLDFETSGLIVVAQNRASQIKLKKLFESREVKKCYVAMTSGEIKNDMTIEAKMDLANNYDDVKMRMQICEDGKDAVTKISPIEYFADIDATFVRAVPLTGRQHQIRLHLFHVEHKILGEPLYGLDREQIIKILDKEMSEIDRINLTGASRLLLHSDEILFELDGKNYHIKSKFDAKTEFYKFAKEKFELT
ncbi:pseudouridine synthase family protein [Campylobacter sp. RM16187]|uniref:pseudouridine synthase family protein n=1 Tax=Campylobacter sp. RM16187 TaxID=1660063 RepID=UPI0021B5FE61|nr:RluA family pseudouridine synthase [Campylobacter sp. RM16187]QKG28386.1 23S rRNA pseudouridine synthase, RluD family [Campylobacter sp. RM16187]